MEKTGNFIYENRAMSLFQRHAPMILKPAAVGIVFVIIWYCMQKYNLYLIKSDLALSLGVSLLGIVYGVMSALVINSNWDKYKALSLSVVRQDKENFLEQRDEKMPIMLHILLGGMALALQIFFMIIKYENKWAGSLCVFNSAFFLCLIGLIALELDNPVRSIWFQKSIPPQWLEEDVKNYFYHKTKRNLSIAE
jgi:membrane associated rhomboid family serine protease